MKIGITCYPTYGGSGVVATELGLELAARGHEIHFISYAMPVRITQAAERIQFHEVEVMNYPLFDHPPYTLALATKMYEVGTSQGLDLMHVHYAIPHSVSAYLARAMATPRHIPFVTTLHGTDITLVGIDRSYLPITRFSIEQSDAVTAISGHLRAKTLEQLKPRCEVEVIPNFVNCDLFRPGEGGDRRGSLAPGDHKVLMHLSNFRPVKRVVDVVEIFARVAAKVPATLVLIGDGPERSAAEWVARDKGLASQIRFLGKQDRVHELLPCADLLLLPSDMESFGLAALEAMACEVPVICSRVGGVPEVFQDGVEGFLVEPRDVDTMAERALEILTDSGRQASMGRAARARALDQFCASKIVPRYEELYRSVLENSAP